MFKAYRSETDLALKAVRLAAILCRQIQQHGASPDLDKPDRSPVTAADFASQALIAFLLKQAFPGDPIVGEEDSRLLRNPVQKTLLQAVTAHVASVVPEATPQKVCAWIDQAAAMPTSRFWALDPLDGTKGFIRGGQYAVALALIEDGQVLVGALGCPNLDRKLQPSIQGPGSAVVAVRGQGAWVAGLEKDDPTPLQVSSTEDPRKARLLRSVESSHTDEHKMALLIDRLGIRPSPVLMDSQAKYAVMAGGGADLLYRLLPSQQPQYRESIWDQAAGSIVLEEAGGKITDLRGRPLDFDSGRTLRHNLGVVASNGLLHQAAIQAAHIVGADRTREDE
ncbi:MAG: 3'(2'),5'-bisphosphate nucleotidase [Anaerolineales bacterium]